MSIEKRRNEFREWALVTVQNNATIDGYIESLDRDIPEYLNIESIFSIENIDEISNLHSRCGVNGDLYEFSRNIGNGRPQAALGKYKKYLQYSYIRQSMKKYESSPNYFDLNGAYWYFSIAGNDTKYPIKAICRDTISNLNLEDDFTTNQAKLLLKGIFPQNTIDFLDINNQQELIENELVEHEYNTLSYLDIKNIILYGSPGVGKTYNTNQLIKLIEDRKSTSEIFHTIKLNDKSDSADISDIKERVKFVTFHQSFGYEDFIEGFRPNESGNIELADGVFKLLCEKARKNLIDSQKPQEELSKKESFKKVLEAFIDEVESEIESKGIYLLTKNVYISDVEDDAFRYKGDNWTIHSSGIRMRFDVLEELYLEGVRSRQDVKKAYNIGGLAKQHATYFWRVMEKIYEVQSKQNIQTSAVEKVERKNYYLVIDEINRGNISKIFGELITLIEEDKRDTLEVTLPYSKKLFKIPSNLYIIGTMNSTDKSIALIDIALRRRFTFLKMEPNLELIENVEAKRIMEQLNERITETLGADYVLGHSYFMQIENDDDLEFVLEYKIKPLLEEYFYGDSEGLNTIMEIMNEQF